MLKSHQPKQEFITGIYLLLAGAQDFKRDAGEKEYDIKQGKNDDEKEDEEEPSEYHWMNRLRNESADLLTDFLIDQ